MHAPCKYLWEDSRWAKCPNYFLWTRWAQCASRNSSRDMVLYKYFHPFSCMQNQLENELQSRDIKSNITIQSSNRSAVLSPSPKLDLWRVGGLCIPRAPCQPGSKLRCANTDGEQLIHSQLLKKRSSSQPPSSNNQKEKWLISYRLKFFSLIHEW